MTRTSQSAGHRAALSRPVQITVDDGAIAGDLMQPESARGLVIFAHGSGSGRFSPRNRMVADAMGQAHLSTLLVDLLTQAEERIDEQTAELRFDISLLARRVMSAIDWARAEPETRDLSIGLFGASTGAAAALVAAARRPQQVRAVVSRGGRPDLAEGDLDIVEAPTLLIVGGRDPQVMDLNRQALGRLRTAHLEIVPGATHLFGEAGALDAVARLATDWFGQHLS